MTENERLDSYITEHMVLATYIGTPLFNTIQQSQPHADESEGGAEERDGGGCSRACVPRRDEAQE